MEYKDEWDWPNIPRVAEETLAGCKSPTVREKTPGDLLLFFPPLQPPSTVAPRTTPRRPRCVHTTPAESPRPGASFGKLQITFHAASLLAAGRWARPTTSVPDRGIQSR